VLDEIQAIITTINADIEAGVEIHDFHKHTDIATGKGGGMNRN
jgi:hypothetical protein